MIPILNASRAINKWIRCNRDIMDSDNTTKRSASDAKSDLGGKGHGEIFQKSPKHFFTINPAVFFLISHGKFTYDILPQDLELRLFEPRNLIFDTGNKSDGQTW